MWRSPRPLSQEDSTKKEEEVSVLRRRIRWMVLGICLITVLSVLILPRSIEAKNAITLDFYYTSTCSHCKQKIPVIQAIEKNYSATARVRWRELTNSTNMQDWRAHGSPPFPSVLIQNETKVLGDNITYDTLKTILDNYIHDLGPGYFQDETIIDVPFFGRVDTKTLSLPVLTVTLGALDSINPCSFFVLFFLLSLLISLQSRRRMLLIGGIFIFFSGFIYFLFMFILYNALAVVQTIWIISIAVGVVAIVMGVINMKDFFFFKQGPSLSIPEEKRPVIFGRMRRLVRTTYLPAILGGAVFLAVTVNFYELLCTLGFPLVYTTQLAAYHLPAASYYLYLILYNIVYVIPLIIILAVFTFTLGRAKLSEWRGRQLKLLSGIMILSFGVFFIVDITLLQNVWVPVVLLLVSVAMTLLISGIVKRRMPPAQPSEPDVTGDGEAGLTGTIDSGSTSPPAP